MGTHKKVLVASESCMFVSEHVLLLLSYYYYDDYLEKGCFIREFILDHQQVNLFIVSKGGIVILSYVTFPFGIKDECMIRPEAFSTPNRWLVNKS